MPYTQIIYITAYFLVILYYVLLGCWMFAYKDNPVSTRGELEAKRRMTNCVGGLMILWAFEYFLCLPSLLRTFDIEHPSYKICFLIMLALSTPAIYVVIRVILQKWEGTIKNACALCLPFLLICVWYIFFDWNGMTSVKVAAAICVTCVLGFIVKYAKDYHTYIRRLQSEYSETTGRDIFWSCWCFMGLAMQLFVYIWFALSWNFILDILYLCLSVVNAGFICHCTRQQKVMDNDIVAEDVENAVETTPLDVANDEKTDEKAFYTVIEQKLESLCEKNQLFLEPDLTRETLCLRLSIGRTYLSMYLHSRGLTFYQYINTLRVEYAVKLMQENPEMPIHKISGLSGFRTQTTFRKVFHEVMGCLPSELQKNPPHLQNE